MIRVTDGSGADSVRREFSLRISDGTQSAVALPTMVCTSFRLSHCCKSQSLAETEPTYCYDNVSRSGYSYCCTPTLQSASRSTLRTLPRKGWFEDSAAPLLLVSGLTVFGRYRSELSRL